MDVGLNVHVLAFTTGAALVTLLLFGVLPAWQTSDIDSATAMKTASRSISGGNTRTRRLLIASQVALTMVLVMGACLFIETLQNLRRESVGFVTHETLDAQLLPLPGGEVEKSMALAYFSDLLDRMRNLSGVDDASLSSFSPLLTMPYKEDIRRLDSPDRPIIQAPAEFVSDGFLRTMRIPLLQGSDFRRTGGTGIQKTAIVSESLARKLFPKENSLGRHIRFGSELETQDLEIVGIAADARLQDPRSKEFSFLYLNLWQLPRRGNQGNLQLRYSGTEAQVITGLQSELRKDGRQYTIQIRTLAEQHESSLFQEKLLAALGASFGLLALTLAAIGLFGLLSFFVMTRTSEIGLRIALGAARHHICLMVIKEAFILVGMGILVGFPFCYVTDRALSGLIYGLAPTPIVPLILSSVIPLVIAGWATLLPVYRASSVDPLVALRDE